MNSIDTKLIAAARMRGIPLSGPEAPQSVADARDLLFGDVLKDLEEALGVDHDRCDQERRGKSVVTIADDGEGQTPAAMPGTILSLLEGSKDARSPSSGQVQYGR